MRLRLAAVAALLVPALAVAQRGGPPMVMIPGMSEPATAASARRLLTVIAADSMEGRAIWQRGSDRAARYIAGQMRAIGLVPAGDSGYFKKIPGALQANGRVTRLPRFSDLDTVPVERRRLAVNVVGILPGKGLPGADSIVLVGAHYDHVGIGRPVNGIPSITEPTTTGQEPLQCSRSRAS